MPLTTHQETAVTITAVSPYGSEADANGTLAFIDLAKHPSWWSPDIPAPQVGDRLHTVVLDATRTPPRLSALQKDMEIARVLRSRG
ncbi:MULTISPECIES: hypothetical protein [Streptomyces]|uniref:Uncharacterized protein n=1 Tax=Streptomyces cyaneofuscatus TaxID=66883 RepID=A0ABZ1EZC5_9ACTN|nr:hypothetical protein [Streptomyces cyaneofuscatus]WSB09519.1 hypothetical protein OG849_20935 [Streptomyces cyaneofuscatus]WSD46946.1 hypothetical protein OG857_14470 [Streptomyces cyaneofuscatus]WTA90345.1 hypothetical protein OG323_15610 [Streptomyces cyaneofuscatus]